ncbi:MAG: FIST C-terminal domain-containing protein [Candidatus Eremiobacteraeota bacterium]|nr:FIST C-terminal domain-containing protein [Candidatus Eremiobacteraeota bacterium]
MLIEESRWDSDTGWTNLGSHRGDADLVLYFGSRSVLLDAERYTEMRAAYPRATIAGCSATRSIAGDVVEEDVVVAVALRFAHTSIRLAQGSVTNSIQSRDAGTAIGETLAAKDLAAIFLLADGLLVDETALTAGVSAAVGDVPLIIGGMASDPRDYEMVLVGADCAPTGGVVAAVGFYGDAIRFAHGRGCGWDAFGPRRRVTKANGNVLFELDGKPAYELYRRYLGDVLSGRAASEGVIYPLSISSPEDAETTLVRAPLAIDDGPASMTFAGHVPEGWMARLMRGNADRLILGAAEAARQAHFVADESGAGDTLALVVSCAGRHQMMGQRTEEELEAVGAELAGTTRIGFYSFGEIAPVGDRGGADVHNQTICITSLTEISA